MDFGEFVSASGQASDSDHGLPAAEPVSFSLPGTTPVAPAITLPGSNWSFAAVNVGVWSTVLAVGWAVPVAASVESFNHTPVQQTDYSWVWSYSVTVSGAAYTAQLHGKYQTGGVRWDMYITKQNEYSNFHWYYGESDLPATQGYWILANKPSDPTDLLQIDWHRNLADGTKDIKYTNIVPGGAENGGYISYGITSQTPYNHFYEIFNKVKSEHTYIEWNGDTKEGRVKDSLHFGNDQWHYWDASRKNTESTV
jgi:hypothetical protein